MIGKDGATITRLRETYSCEINFDEKENKVKVSGDDKIYDCVKEIMKIPIELKKKEVWHTDTHTHKEHYYHFTSKIFTNFSFCFQEEHQAYLARQRIRKEREERRKLYEAKKKEKENARKEREQKNAEKNAEKKDKAELFLNFLCREDIAKINFEYIYYSTPNKAVKADITIAISDSLGFGGHNGCVAFRKVNG